MKPSPVGKVKKNEDPFSGDVGAGIFIGSCGSHDLFGGRAIASVSFN